MNTKAPTTALLSVTGLDKRYGRVVTAEDVSFEVPEGSVLGIVGPNGAGKSTLLGMVSGTVRPDGGTVRLDGADVTSLGAARRSTLGIARSHQIPRPFVGMTVFENVLVGSSFGGKHSGKDPKEAALDALELTGLRPLADTPAGQLRLLDRKRLELARALATSPRLILLDEIAGGLTERELPDLIALVARLRDDGVTVVWIEHIVHALLQVVDDLLCLAGGEVIAHGEPRGVLAHPRVVEAYLGSAVEPDELAS